MLLPARGAELMMDSLNCLYIIFKLTGTGLRTLFASDFSSLKGNRLSGSKNREKAFQHEMNLWSIDLGSCDIIWETTNL